MRFEMDITPNTQPEIQGGRSFNLYGRYTIDPVVSCRIEGNEGAILFNPDLNTVTLINSSGVLIWDFLKEPHTVDEVITFLCGNMTECPNLGAIQTDVVSFITDLIPGYILEV